MATEVPDRRESIILWLLESDPSIRWQVIARPERRVPRGSCPGAVAGCRRRVGLAAPRPPEAGRQVGRWNFVPQWQSTLCTMGLLRDMGLDPSSERARKAVAVVRDRVTWGPGFGDSPFFEGEVEPCINGRVLGLGSYFGQTSDRLLDRLLGEQLADGGWNCETERGSVRSSFHTTICVLEGFLEYEKTNGPTVALSSARVRAEEYLLERRMFGGCQLVRSSMTEREVTTGTSSPSRPYGITMCSGAWTTCVPHALCRISALTRPLVS